MCAVRRARRCGGGGGGPELRRVPEAGRRARVLRAVAAPAEPRVPPRHARRLRLAHYALHRRQRARDGARLGPAGTPCHTYAPAPILLTNEYYTSTLQYYVHDLHNSFMHSTCNTNKLTYSYSTRTVDMPIALSIRSLQNPNFSYGLELANTVRSAPHVFTAVICSASASIPHLPRRCSRSSSWQRRCSKCSRSPSTTSSWSGTCSTSCTRLLPAIEDAVSLSPLCYTRAVRWPPVS